MTVEPTLGVDLHAATDRYLRAVEAAWDAPTDPPGVSYAPGSFMESYGASLDSGTALEAAARDELIEAAGGDPVCTWIIKNLLPWEVKETIRLLRVFPTTLSELDNDPCDLYFDLTNREIEIADWDEIRSRMVEAGVLPG